MLRKLKNVNQISEQFEKEIPELEPGQIALFQMLNGVNVQDAVTGSFETCYPKEQIPMHSIIRDPYTKKDVLIGVPKIVENDEVKEWDFFSPGLEYGHAKFGGKFQLNGDIPLHRERFTHLMITDLNGNKAGRNKSVTPLFEHIDLVEKAKSDRKKTNALRDALNLIDTLETEEARQLNSIINNSNATDKFVVFSELEAYAKANPEGFNSHFTDPLRRVKTDIKQAIEANVIAYEPTTGKVLFVKGNSLIASLEKHETKDWLTLFAEWIQSAQNGKKVHDSLKKQTKQATTLTEEVAAD